MKITKYLSSILVLASLFFASCDDSGEIQDVDSGIRNAGAVTTLKGTSGKLLGALVTPTDIPNSKVNLSDVNAELDLTLNIAPGSVPSGVSKYELIKVFNNQEVSITESNSLPISLKLTTVSDFFDGFTSVDFDKLRIGDKIQFLVKVYLENGDVFTQASNASKYDVVINCASSLAGTYVVDYNSGPGTHIVTEVSPGLYEMDSMLGWPGGGYTVTFTDTCNATSLINDWQFSNVISGSGNVAGNGDINWVMSVEDVYDGNTFTMVKQ